MEHRERAIIVVSGLPAAGVTTLCEEIRGFAGYPVLSFGKMLGELQLHRDDDASKWEIAQKERSERGRDALAALLSTDIAEYYDGEDVIVVDGARTIEEIEHFNRTFDSAQVYLVWVTADRDIRKRRYRERGRDEREMRERVTRETEVGVEELCRKALIHVENNPRNEELSLQAAKVLDLVVPHYVSNPESII